MKKNDSKIKEQYVNGRVSQWFFIIPIIIIIINIILGYVYYNSLPNKVATHWDFSGNITGFQPKSIFLIWEMPLSQIFITVVFFLIYKALGHSKNNTSFSNSKFDLQRNNIFARTWSIYMIVFCALINIVLTMGTLQILNVFYISEKFSAIVIGIFLVITFSSVIILSVKLGQGGSNIKLEGETKENKISKIHRDDRKYWKFGNIIYYNPDDPSLFVEKKFGIGWAINAGKPAGMAIYIGLIVLIVIITALARHVGR
ncbi:DUF1648 domain-containing protein [Clostridium tyrobutyricum]|jgi:uncharacterized membrane protein|uniref:DUF1648 domain-containing protein n=2 Tax=Clostridium tyrobutyricum TaxID=1519 RepID=W6N3F8_CLOTY|nr:DUF1648 domain-containing protein [Clostridium tyrobutyricum]AND84079.1 hypothetical protein CTK_C08180 [Clostridium tyrobutyricum]ANP68809.1 hypothetical protein BA182_03715 [Clostridium tyrobutyricum]MBR9647223.1 DUF1648 domain-containing protein [Clostridium tyrobutyricum]MBV4416163.1 DUF1648 domain-containing protein [Clostridium tyrobutyricum]MBV4416236.1 DUF1648 domain-containing protein [Clostridium tyrobutyricum]